MHEFMFTIPTQSDNYNAGACPCTWQCFPQRRANWHFEHLYSFFLTCEKRCEQGKRLFGCFWTWGNIRGTLYLLHDILYDERERLFFHDDYSLSNWCRCYVASSFRFDCNLLHEAFKPPSWTRSQRPVMSGFGNARHY